MPVGGSEGRRWELVGPVAGRLDECDNRAVRMGQDQGDTEHHHRGRGGQRADQLPPAGSLIALIYIGGPYVGLADTDRDGRLAHNDP